MRGKWRPWWLITWTCLYIAGTVLHAEAARVDKPPLRLALLVGISKYDQSGSREGLKPWSPLNSEKDLAELQVVLITHYGFQPNDFLILKDGDATKEKIRQGFQTHLIDKAQPGAIIVFHFSGHGQQIKDVSGDELDGLDESLVTVDARDQSGASGARTNIVDDELAVWLRALQNKMREKKGGRVQGSINVFLDTCYSGTATRGLLNERGRGWDPTLDGPLPPQAAHLTAQSGQSALTMAEVDGDYVLLSAARSDQTAKERDGMGVFTWALVSALARAHQESTYGAILDDVIDTVAHRPIYDQTPQLEGNAELRLFSGTALPSQPYARVIDYRDGILTLPVGELHLVTEGSVFAIHRAGGGKLDDTTFLADAAVISTTPYTSQLRVRPAYNNQQFLPADFRAARASEEKHCYAESPLRLHLQGLDDRSDLLERARRLDVFTERGVTSQDYEVQVKRNGNHLELRRAEACYAVATIALDGDAADHLEMALRAEWRWQRLYGLQQDNPDVRVRLRLIPVSVALGPQHQLLGVPRKSPSKAWGNDLRLAEGSFIMFELSNSTGNDLYVTVLELGPSGAIQTSFPSLHNPHDNLISRHSTKILNARPFLFQLSKPYGRSLFRVIATREPVDLGLLSQHAYELTRAWNTRSAGELRAAVGDLGSSLNPLAQLVAAAVAGERIVDRVDMARVAWGTSDARLEILPPRGAGRSSKRAAVAGCFPPNGKGQN